MQETQTYPSVPTVTYKPTADCSYSQLVNRIQGSQLDGMAQNKSETETGLTQNANQLSYEQQQQQYYQYYYAMQYYEYYKQLVQQFHNMGGKRFCISIPQCLVFLGDREIFFFATRLYSTFWRSPRIKLRTSTIRNLYLFIIIFLFI